MAMSNHCANALWLLSARRGNTKSTPPEVDGGRIWEIFRQRTLTYMGVLQITPGNEGPIPWPWCVLVWVAYDLMATNGDTTLAQ